jgi:LacI family transcriptional regulator
VAIADRHINRNGHCTVSVDDFVGGQLAAAHLLEQGHLRLAVAGGMADLRQVRDRREGAARAVLTGSRKATLTTISTPKLDIAAGRTAAETIAEMPPTRRPTAVFATNDLVAIGLLQGLVSRNIRVPDDIAIIGYDDIEYAAAATVPLSSIRQPRADLGRRAAELLLADIHATEDGTDHDHEQVLFTPELIVRESSDFPRVTNQRKPPSRISA